MASSDDSDINILESLRRQEADPKYQNDRIKAAEERKQAEYSAAHRRMSDVIGHNSTLPVTISSIGLLGGSHTRHSFLDRIFKPLLSVNRDQPYTLQEVIQEATSAAHKLRKFDIFHNDISLFLDEPDPLNPSTTPTDISIFLRARERSRLSLKTGTDLGNVEGSAYLNVLLRNLFGGAESLNLNASTGTRTRSAYQATFDTPVLSDPDKKIAIDLHQSSTSNFWASHDEALKGGKVRYMWAAKNGSRHQVAYTGVWRQITGLGEKASASVRLDAGDSVKSSVSHTWIADRRDDPLLPQSGYLLKTLSEIAGWGPMMGDVGFWKSEVESSAAVSIPIPGMEGKTGVSMTGSFRAGALYPLPVGLGSIAQPSLINDRFQLGGPTDVRGFKMGGLGPRDGQDALGGEVFAAGSLALLMPVPRAGRDSPLRFQIFANGGRLLALKKGDRAAKSQHGDRNSVQRSVYSTIGELGNGLPSIAAGIGLVYAHPVARFELNLALPVVVRKGEETRKGLQFGVGINFL